MENLNKSTKVEAEQVAPACGNTLLCDVFNLFTADDKFRPAFKKPFINDDKVCATDSYVAIFIDEKDCDFEVNNEYEPPRLISIVPPENKPVVLDLKKIDWEKYKTEDETRKVGEDIDCSVCNGFGEVEWEFQKWEKYFDCPACEGSGKESEAHEEKTGEKTFGPFRVKLGNTYFDVAKFYKLIKVQEMLGGEIELLNNDYPRNGNLFRVGKCNVIIMPMLLENVEDCDGVINIA